jgi:hypothetical protein
MSSRGAFASSYDPAVTVAEPRLFTGDSFHSLSSGFGTPISCAKIVAIPLTAGRLAPARKGIRVSYTEETPFDSIEGSHEYVAMLATALDEARRDVEQELALAEHEGAERRKQALLLVSYNLDKLNLHIASSRKILNDLRSLRRLLLAERVPPVFSPGP